MSDKLTENMKAGWQTRKDPMRVRANQMDKHPGHAKDTYYSEACADKDKIRKTSLGHG